MTRARGGHSPVDILAHLEDVEYPATKGDLVQAAQADDAPDKVIREIRNLAKDRFEDREDVRTTYETLHNPRH